MGSKSVSASSCLRNVLWNAQDRLKPVLEAFGIDGSDGSQRQLDFGDDPSQDDPQDDD